MKITKLQGSVNTVKSLLDARRGELRLPPLSFTQLSRLQRAVEKGDVVFFTAESDDGALVAAASVAICFSTRSCEESGFFDDFYVVPVYRKTRVAKELCAAVFEHCRSSEIRTLSTVCSDRERASYKQLGFTVQNNNLAVWTDTED